LLHGFNKWRVFSHYLATAFTCLSTLEIAVMISCFFLGVSFL